LCKTLFGDQLYLLRGIKVFWFLFLQLVGVTPTTRLGLGAIQTRVNVSVCRVWLERSVITVHIAGF